MDNVLDEESYSTTDVPRPVNVTVWLVVILSVLPVTLTFQLLYNEPETVATSSAAPWAIPETVVTSSAAPWAIPETVVTSSAAPWAIPDTVWRSPVLEPPPAVVWTVPSPKIMLLPEILPETSIDATLSLKASTTSNGNPVWPAWTATITCASSESSTANSVVPPVLVTWSTVPVSDRVVEPLTVNASVS